MKIILSRKGFDSTYGGIPSPILPDGTLLSMPIPSLDDTLSFEDLQYGGHTYREILQQLATERRYKSKFRDARCHLDPDIREGVRIKPESNWKPAFGQIDQAQSYLSNRGVGKDDLFLFFGRFQKTIGDIAEGTLEFNKKEPIIHIIYGYMQIGDVVSGKATADLNFKWHPHGSGERANEDSNTLYLPADKLSFGKGRCGWGTFKFAESRVLTLSKKTATWKRIDCLLPEWVDKDVKNNAEDKDKGIYYQGQWQELVLKEDSPIDDWIKEIFKT